MKIKTSTLIDVALDWAVSKCENRKYVYSVTTGGDYNGNTTHGHTLNYSTDWAQGGPILTEARISRTIDHSGLWVAYWTDGYDDSDAGKKWMQCDRSELVAGLRCYVASKLGDEVEIPEELT